MLAGRGSSPRVAVAWAEIGGAGSAALQHQVSRYDDSGSDEEWDSIGAGGSAAAAPPTRGGEVVEDLEDARFSFEEEAWSAATQHRAEADRSLHSIGGGSGAARTAAIGANAPAVPAAAPAPEPAPEPEPEPEPEPTAPGRVSPAAAAAAAARVRVAAAGNSAAASAATAKPLGPEGARASREKADRERRARAAEERLRQRAAAELAAERKKLASDEAARAAAAQKAAAAAAEPPGPRPAPAPRPASDAAAAMPVPSSNAFAQQDSGARSTARRPTRPPPGSPLRTSTLESKFQQLQQVVRDTPKRKSKAQARSGGTPLRESLELERQGTAEAMQALREASVEEAGWEAELAEVRAAIADVENEAPDAGAAAAAPSKGQGRKPPASRALSGRSTPRSPSGMYLQPAGSAPKPVKWSDVGSPAEVRAQRPTSVAGSGRDTANTCAQTCAVGLGEEAAQISGEGVLS